MNRGIPQMISDAIPVKWDRYVPYEDQITMFGWIARSDGQRDFVLIWYNETSELKDVSFATSSAKYSRQLGELFGSEHCDCIKVPEHLNSMSLNDAMR